MKNLEYYRGLLSDPLLTRIQATPDVPVERARNGEATVSAGGRHLHSTHDPGREARRFVERWAGENPQAGTILVIGSGLGYHINMLLERYPAATLFLQPLSMSMLRQALRLNDWTKHLQSRRLRIRSLADHEPLPEDTARFVWPASAQIFSDALQEWQLQEVTQNQRSLRISIVGPVSGGSYPIAVAVVKALERLGHEVDFIDHGDFAAAHTKLEQMGAGTTHERWLLGSMVQLLSDATLVEVERFQPQLVIALAQAPLSHQAVRELRRNGIVTAFWFVEDYETIEYWESIAPEYDLFFTIQKGRFHERLRKLGVQRPHYLPLAADTDQYFPLQTDDSDPEFTAEISFVGAGYHNRQIFFLGLTGYPLKIWGGEWNPGHPCWQFIQNNGERTDPEMNNRIFNGTQINLNLHSSQYLPGVNPDGDFVNPRVFDIAATGQFQLVDERSLLSELFAIGEEMITYRSIEELREKIEYFRRRPEEMQAVGKAAQARVMRDHTYDVRMQQLLDTVTRAFPQLLAQAEPRNRVEELRRSLTGDEEWQQLLAGYAPDETLTLRKLENDIRSREGENTADQIILFLAEVERWAESKGLQLSQGVAR